jgi:hypothetical protein
MIRRIQKFATRLRTTTLSKPKRGQNTMLRVVSTVQSIAQRPPDPAPAAQSECVAQGHREQVAGGAAEGYRDLNRLGLRIGHGEPSHVIMGWGLARNEHIMPYESE